MSNSLAICCLKDFGSDRSQWTMQVHLPGLIHCFLKCRKHSIVTGFFYKNLFTHCGIQRCDLYLCLLLLSTCYCCAHWTKFKNFILKWTLFIFDAFFRFLKGYFVIFFEAWVFLWLFMKWNVFKFGPFYDFKARLSTKSWSIKTP